MELALIETKNLGIDRALVTCDKKNIGSVKAIIKNGGQFDEEYPFEGRIVQRYWIEIQ